MIGKKCVTCTIFTGNLATSMAAPSGRFRVPVFLRRSSHSRRNWAGKQGKTGRHETAVHHSLNGDVDDGTLLQTITQAFFRTAVDISILVVVRHNARREGNLKQTATAQQPSKKFGVEPAATKLTTILASSTVTLA